MSQASIDSLSVARGLLPLKRKQVMSQASIDSLLVARGLLPLQIPFLFVVFPLPPLFWFRY
jgi:hypothetical protein